MTATDELRAMLDERGVEYIREGFRNTRIFRPDGVKLRIEQATNQPRDCQLKITTNFMSVKEAVEIIEATLGRGTCRDLGDGQMFICSECGCTLDIQDENGEPTMMVDGVADVPKCCPNCKREVVDE